MTFCGTCGKAVILPVVSPGEARNRFCVGCGRAMSWDVNVCQYCGHDYRTPAKDATKDYLVVGGVLTTIAGVFSIVLTTIIISTMGDMAPESVALAMLIYSCGVIGILGGILAMMRKLFPFAVLGAACAIMGPAFFFGIPGLVLIAKSSRQFEDAQR
jgi:uncharacterized protein (DUF983 family)